MPVTLSMRLGTISCANERRFANLGVIMFFWRDRAQTEGRRHAHHRIKFPPVALDELSATGTATSAAPSSSAAAQAKSMFYDVGIDDVVLGISNDPVGLVGCTVVLTFVFCAAQMVTPD